MLLLVQSLHVWVVWMHEGVAPATVAAKLGDWDRIQPVSQVFVRREHADNGICGIRRAAEGALRHACSSSIILTSRPTLSIDELNHDVPGHAEAC
jgi:hypothetical protein